MNRLVAVAGIIVALMLVALGYVMYAEHGSETGWSLGPANAVPPTQPVLFSHKVHAGERNISCQYCHQFVAKAAAAGIPPSETCVGCHRPLDTAKLQDTSLPAKVKLAEIAKFMTGPPGAAQLKDPEQPFPWLRVYDLPDHVRFSHHVHVKALANDSDSDTTCVFCHGAMKQMEQVRQTVDLIRMGTCLSCHRQQKAATDCYACHY
ncbi:MAG: cytochrome c3 family protein [Cyanobacteria bacterium NC_groundwater_1444_Ag_S-0.65um_54_12]|nr:cytochrome c3 family protein [Cyanobacteria bacterium NC_groundwater_1444_Ag_S-0.65um_54_12]